MVDFKLIIAPAYWYVVGARSPDDMDKPDTLLDRIMLATREISV